MKLRPSSNNGISHRNKCKIFEFNCSNKSSPKPFTSIDSVIALSNKNVNIYTNESWGCNHRIKRVVVRYMTLKVGYHLSRNLSWNILDDGRWGALSEFFSLVFWWVGSGAICYFYRFIYLYMPLYQLYTFSMAFMLKSKPFCRLHHTTIVIRK